MKEQKEIVSKGNLVLFFSTVIVFLIAMVVMLSVRLKAEQKDNADLTESIQNLCAANSDFQDEIEGYAARVDVLERMLEESEESNNERVVSKSKTLYEQYFTGINFSDGLNSREIYYLNKQMAICDNEVSLDTIKKKLELANFLKALVDNAAKSAQGDVLFSLQILQEDLQNQQTDLQELYELYLKNQEDLKNYDQAVPK